MNKQDTELRHKIQANIDSMAAYVESITDTYDSMAKKTKTLNKNCDRTEKNIKNIKNINGDLRDVG